jgi:hypothetical protein
MAEEKMSASEKKKEDWMNSKWRPMMGWMYMFVCFFDFVLAPVMWSLLQSIYHGAVNVQWQPLTLQGAGLFHISMGAVLGIAAYGRTQEKLNGANNGGLPTTGSVGTTYTPPAPIGQSSAGSFGAPASTPSFSAPTTNSFGSQPMGSGSGFGSVAQPASTSFGGGFGASAPAIVTSSSGKPGPVQPDFPAI